jgi:hypothetical protein
MGKIRFTVQAVRIIFLAILACALGATHYTITGEHPLVPVVKIIINAILVFGVIVLWRLYGRQ